MWKTITLGLGLFCLVGCQQIQFYGQAIKGQGQLLMQREDVETLLSNPSVNPVLKVRLGFARDVIAFARDQGLPTAGTYDSYVATGQQFVIWNVFAAEPLQLALKQSCFPVAGCVSYRGFFDQDDARRYARQLEADGYETYIGGVTAYSTLGWFNDPLLDTFLFRQEDDLAALLFHELAHQLLYIKGDTRFNESLATAVERFMMRKWLAASGDEARFERYMQKQARASEVIQLVELARSELKDLYDGSLPVAVIRDRKEKVISSLVADYERLAGSWDEGEEFAHWMRTPINNAKLETVADYHEWVPVMLSILEACGLQGFLREMQKLSDLKLDERELRLMDCRGAVLALQHQVAHTADNSDADKVQDHALSCHQAGREPAR